MERQQGQTTPEIRTAPRHNIQLQKPQKHRLSTQVARRWMAEYPRYYRKFLITLLLHALYLLKTP